MFALRATTLAILFNCLGGVLAGPAATVHACINLQTRPSDKFTVTFDPVNGQNQCMILTGNKATIEVTAPGLSCTAIGYVEAKSSASGGDFCSTDESIWNISYSTQNLANNTSGSIKTRWRRWSSQINEISFYAHARASMVCGSPALCNSELFAWDTGTAPPAYGSQIFIFRPNNQGTAMENEVSEDLTQFVIEADAL
ncbi:hypothetical protein MMC11_007155 [Xylographa trunciseda]|nr:hypothetical protein [Xylographa trunciseda]